MPDLALDFSWARPPAHEIAAAGIVLAIAYTGQGKPRPTRDYIQSLLDVGVGFMFVGESSATRSQEGYTAGVQDAAHDNAAMDAVGYPAECVLARAMSDQNARVPGPELIPAMAEYAHGYGAVIRAPGWLAYGNVFAVRAAMRGATNCIGGWVPSSWVIDNGDYHIIQEANLAPPIPQTDLNTIYRPFPWWGATPASQPLVHPPDLEDPMISLGMNTVTGKLVAMGVGEDQCSYWCEQSADGSWTGWAPLGTPGITKFQTFVKAL